MDKVCVVVPCTGSLKWRPMGFKGAQLAKYKQGTCSMPSCQQEHSPTREIISLHCKAHKLQCQSHAQVTFITRAIRDSSCLSASCLLKAPSLSAVLCRICSISTSYSPAASCKLQLSSAPFVFKCLMTCREPRCCNQGTRTKTVLPCSAQCLGLL